MRKILFYYALFIFSWIYSLYYLFADYDLWARLAVGKIFFQTGKVLNNDIFSFSMAKPLWIDHEWGSGVIFYFLANNFGDKGLLLLKIIIFFLIMLIVSKIIKLQNPVRNAHLNLVFYFLLFISIFHGLSWTVRCQQFTFLFFALWIYILERVRHGENRLLWTFPAMMLIWINLHGGAIAGIGLLLIYGIGEFLNKNSFKKYFLILLPTIAVTLINPYGIEYIKFILYATTMPRPFISEWRPTELFGPLAEWKNFKLLLIISSISLGFYLAQLKFNLSKIDKVKILLLLATLFLALNHYKHQPFFVITAGALLYHDFYALLSFIHLQILSRTGKFLEFSFKQLNLIKNIVVYLIIIPAISIIFINPLKIYVSPNKYPVYAIEFIKINNLQGNLLVPFGWGSYAAWKLFPQNLIAIDGRYEEVYPEAVFMMTHNFYYQELQEHWQDFIKTYHTDIVITDKSAKAYQSLTKSEEWQEIFQDKLSAVFVPVNSVRKSYISPNIDLKTINDNKYLTSIDFSGKY